MISVLLVDDEILALRHLQAAIDWQRLGLRVAAAVTNGLDALEVIRNRKIDILITDIKMPGMDGLELCRKIRETDAEMQIILLTGYSDFDYALQAIRFQAVDYCLKPIDTEKLTQTLTAAVRNQFRHTVTRADAMLDLMEESNVAELSEAFQAAGLRGTQFYLAGSVGLHNIEKELEAELSLKTGKHKYLYISSVPMNRTRAEEKIAFASGRSGIGFLADPVPIDRLAEVTDDILIMTLQYFINGSPTLCDSVVESTYTDAVFKKLALLKNDPAALKKWLQELADSNCSMTFNIRTALRFINRAATCPALQNSTDDETYIYGYDQMAVDYLHFSDLLRELASLIQAEPEKDAPAAPCTDSFLAILSYINENYAGDISLQKISDRFHLNASYISQLIKSETGLTYTRYLTDLRIQKAKELLTSTDLTLLEISEAVGFHDYFYFIKKFKKEVGVTPGKFV